MYRNDYNIEAKSELNRIYSIEQETETSRIELWDNTSWCILVDTFRNEAEFKANYQKAIEKYETETIGDKILETVKNWRFYYKDGLTSIDEETVIYNGKQARILADFWGDMTIRKTVKDTTIYIENNTIENGCLFIIRNGKDVLDYLKGHTENLRKAKQVFDCAVC